jgi:hypothetical protein
MDIDGSEKLERLEGEEHAIGACALRFDGYAYWETRYRDFGHKDASNPGEVSGMLAEGRCFFENDLDNLLVFFLLQRYLGKWGGERLPENSNEFITFLLLFLHCYRLEIPERFRFEPYYTEWQRQSPADYESLAARVRRSLGAV